MHFSNKKSTFGTVLSKIVDLYDIILSVRFMYKIAIIEDDIFELNQMYETLKQYCQQNNLEIQIDKYSDSTQFLFDIKYDALFLDIIMPNIDGITLAKKILRHYEPLFIFITHKSSLMLDTFSVHAYNFIPKTNLEKRLIPVFEEVVDKLSKINQKVSFKTSQGIVCCLLKDIIYIEINNHTLHIVTKEKTYQCRITLKSIISKINHPSFVLVNQSTLINLDCIKNYQHPAITMINGQTVYVSRNYQKEFKNHLFKYYSNLF